MSAYAALKANSVDGDSSTSTPVNVDEIALQYVRNSDDECSDDEYKFATPDITNLVASVNDSKCPSPSLPRQRITQSNFLPSELCLQIEDDCVIVTLERGDFIMIKGMFKLRILQGNIRVNNCYELNSDTDCTYTFFSTDFHSLPVIANASTENLEMSVVSKIKLINYHTGFSNSTRKLLPFRLIASSDDQNEMLKHFTFQVVIQSDNNIGMFVDESWVNYFGSSAAISPYNLIVMGNKNAGKSTFCKSLLDYLRFQKKQSVVIMDLDPGQSDNSSPYCMSLSIQLPDGACTTSGHVFDKSEEYYGFDSPLDAPLRYLEVTRKLYKICCSRYKQKGYRLIVNTPGWIKGFGKTLLQKVTIIVNPSDLILLTSNLSLEFEENQAVLQGMSYVKATLLPGVFHLPPTAPSQFRNNNKLLYFHHRISNDFEFSHSILNQSPERLSYQVGGSGQGIYGVSILNYAVDASFDFNNIPTLLSCTIWGVYSTSSPCGEVLIRDGNNNIYPNLIRSKDLDLVLGTGSQFLGLLIIHSINIRDHYLNVYAPPSVLKKVKDTLIANSKIVLVRGEGSIPSIELMAEKFLHAGVVTQSQDPHLNLSKTCIPYVSTRGKAKVGGVWKVRRNILRRSQRR